MQLHLGSTVPHSLHKRIRAWLDSETREKEEKRASVRQSEN